MLKGFQKDMKRKGRIKEANKPSLRSKNIDWAGVTGSVRKREQLRGGNRETHSIKRKKERTLFPRKLSEKDLIGAEEN